MADIINNPGDNRGGAGGLIAIILAVVLIIMLVLLFFPGLFDGGEDRADRETGVENTDNDGSIVIPPPTVNNTTINSTSTFNLGTTTDSE